MLHPGMSQVQTYEGPDDPAGDKTAERQGYLYGNRVFIYFQNNTELSRWIPGNVESQWSKWPNTDEGVRMLDGVAFMVGARVYLKNDTIPVTDPVEIKNHGDLDTLYFLQTSYREEMDNDPTGTVEWGFYPVFGYFNPSYGKPAMSDDPESWPPAGWPAAGGRFKWPGEWNGRFGRGVHYADLETYYVVNDAQDQEYLGPEDIVRYYPRPGVKIGDKRPEVTLQKGCPWGGIGVRVEVRSFQWNTEEAKDAIFWEYTIANISDYNLPQLAVGFWIDNGIGADDDDDLGFFDETLDLVYNWDTDGMGVGGMETGTMGFALLETPGMPDDSKDNDDDGLMDERRDNEATMMIGPTDGIHNLDKFLDFYNLQPSDLKEHWDADEDQDWRDGEDMNGDGRYSDGEDPGDDVGLDGLAYDDLNYPGPDPDGSECNHKPDYEPGYGCEPNFNATDVSESDMLGLTAFRLFPVPSHASAYRWFRGDRSMWDLIGSQELVPYDGAVSNLIEVFAAGTFPLHRGNERRISIAEIHSYDDLAGLNSNEHNAPVLFQKKDVIQAIYDNDYRFDNIEPRLIAYFSEDQSYGAPPFKVVFKDDSYIVHKKSADANINSWYWDFGDGSVSNERNPTHVYNTCGVYDVTLIVKNQDGLCDTLTKDNLVLVNYLEFDSFEGINQKNMYWSSCWADINNDNFSDLTIAFSRGEPEFFKNMDGTSFAPITLQGISTFRWRYSHLCWADFDNDNDLDLLDSNNEKIHRNEGDQEFTAISIDSGNITYSEEICWIDFDNDGWLDVFTVHSNKKSQLYRSKGDGTFTPVDDNGLAEDENSTSMAWADYDNDGDVDIYLTKFGKNALYINQDNGYFSLLTNDISVSEVSNSNTASWADFDNDGDLDLFVGNELQDKLFRNLGNGSFETMLHTGIDPDSLFTNSSGWADYNNDGNIDIFVAGKNHNFIYHNYGDGSFKQVPLPLLEEWMTSGSWADYNRDGFIDLYIGSNEALETGGLYRNTGNDNHWINIRCIGTKTNKSSIGTKIRIKATIAGLSKWQMREISSKNGHNNQDDFNAEFGLGQASIIDSLVIEWPSGAVDKYTNIETNQFITATEGQGWYTAIGENQLTATIPEYYELYPVFPNPFNPSATIHFALPEKSWVKIEVFNIIGQKIATLVDSKKPSGEYYISFNASELSSGLYICSMQTKHFAATRKMLYIK